MGKDELSARLAKMSMQQEFGWKTSGEDFSALQKAFEKEKREIAAHVHSVDCLVFGKPKLVIDNS